TLYHISMDFGIHESSASRIIRKVEDILIDSGKFELPKKLPSRVDEDTNWSVVIVDATETPIERPKKTKATAIAVRKNNTP
ncbi:transposase family protein, partial [uncultured Psychrobacter sp.]|uniref:transposase family protein n=1 Tax=uncultured Psychrobacter sp. TaxID=259303 RepID=UPI0026298718